MHQSFTIFLKEVNRFKRSQVTELKIWDETETNTVHETARFNKIKFHFGKDEFGHLWQKQVKLRKRMDNIVERIG